VTILALIAASGSAQAQRHLHLPLPRWKQPRSSHDLAGGQCSSRVHARREQDRARIVLRAKRTLDIYTMIADGTISRSSGNMARLIGIFSKSHQLYGDARHGY
jgi:hypothetical protein